MVSLNRRHRYIFTDIHTCRSGIDVLIDDLCSAIERCFDEAGVLFLEKQFHMTGRTVTLLTDNDLGFFLLFLYILGRKLFPFRFFSYGFQNGS